MPKHTLAPDLSEEKKLWKKGYRCVAGIDEVGRGSLAGPVIAVAITVPKFSIFNFQFSNNFQFNNFQIRDSKKLSAKRRELIYQALASSPLVEWGIGRVSEKVIDKINIFEATKLAMKRSVLDLTQRIKNKKSEITRDRGKYANIDFVILDGNFILPGLKINGTKIPQKSIIKGDEKVFSCAAASIIAKVHRDRIMLKYRRKYPQYGFDKHKGYGTKQHILAIEKFGPCQMHRKSFGPCQKLRNLVN